MSPPLVGSGAASVARPSSGTPQSRWLTMRCFTIRLALAKAPSGSPALIVFWCSMLFSASSWICGAPLAIARNGSVTAGSGSQSTTTSAAASPATSPHVAMTAATGPPPWRTRATDQGEGFRPGLGASPPPPSPAPGSRAGAPGEVPVAANRGAGAGAPFDHLGGLFPETGRPDLLSGPSRGAGGPGGNTGGRAERGGAASAPRPPPWGREGKPDPRSPADL